MPKVEQLDATLTAGGKSRLMEFLQGVPEADSVLAFLKGRNDGEVEKYWLYGTYSADKVATVAHEVELHGHTLLYEVDGITVAVPQFHLLSELEGTHIDEENGRLVLLEQ